MLKMFLLVASGGGIGAVIRELLMERVSDLPGGFPMPIFIANITAAFLIGLVTALAIQGGLISDEWKLFLTTGVTGGMSTFSSLIWGTEQMLANPAEQTTAIFYLVVSVVVGFLAVELGLSAGAAWMRRRVHSHE